MTLTCIAAMGWNATHTHHTHHDYIGCCLAYEHMRLHDASCLKVARALKAMLGSIN